MTRYYTIGLLATRYETTRDSIELHIKAFRIKTKIQNGARSIDSNKLEYFDLCYQLRKKSGMTYSYIKTLPKKLIKLLIERL